MHTLHCHPTKAACTCFYDYMEQSWCKPSKPNIHSSFRYSSALSSALISRQRDGGGQGISMPPNAWIVWNIALKTQR
jgi:hypothetical protein